MNLSIFSPERLLRLESLLHFKSQHLIHLAPLLPLGPKLLSLRTFITFMAIYYILGLKNIENNKKADIFNKRN